VRRNNTQVKPRRGGQDRLLLDRGHPAKPSAWPKVMATDPAHLVLADGLNVLIANNLPVRGDQTTIIQSGRGDYDLVCRITMKAAW
jgi:hypothetical protein